MTPRSLKSPRKNSCYKLISVRENREIPTQPADNKRLRVFCLPNGEFLSQSTQIGTRILGKKSQIRTYAYFNYGANIESVRKKIGLSGRLKKRA